MTTPAALQNLNHIAAFVLAGDARFTLVSKATGERKTFRVVQKDGEEFWFVSLLIGPENTADYRYLGCIFKSRNGMQLCAKQNKDGWGTTAFAAIVWLLAWFNARTEDTSKFFAQVEFWHLGACARCGRDLTDPESIARGLGPKCATMS